MTRFRQSRGTRSLVEKHNVEMVSQLGRGNPEDRDRNLPYDTG